MSTHDFNLRLSCRYEGDDNKVAGLSVEVLKDSEWETFDLNVSTAGFLIFVYTMFTCQHTYMRTNAAERGLLLESAVGSIDIGAGDEWLLERSHVRFEAQLRSGIPTSDDVDFIVNRMQQCPVSKNVKLPADSWTQLQF